MIAVTSSKAWPVVRHCINYEFPIRVAEKVANAQKIVQIARLCLFGTNTKETLLHPDQYELYKTQSLYYLVESFRSEIRPNSSLSSLVGTCCLKITTGGLLRIEKKIPLEEYPFILDLFAQYVDGKKTYDTKGCEEIADPLFEFLHFLQPAELVKGRLDVCLIRQVYRAHQKGQKQLVYVRHKLLEDFLFSTEFELKVDMNFQPFGSRPPQIEAIIDELDTSDEKKFIEQAKACKLRFYGKDHQRHETSLVDCLEGEVRFSNGDTYFKVRGMWYKLAADYLGLIHEDFKTVLKNALISKDAEGWLPRPWRGNKRGGKVTQDDVKVKLVSAKGIRKFMTALKDLTVCYVDGTSVNQKKLVGEILKIPAVSKHKNAIEKILANKFSDKKIIKVCGEEGNEVLKALKKKRKVVQENSSKETYVLNPFPYPMEESPELDGKYDAFVTFLEGLYNESENTEDEETYNRAYLSQPYGHTNGYLVFDQVCPDFIEPCDVLRYTADTVYLYHVKEDFGQHTRDACSQIINSAKMIRSALSTHQSENYLQKLWKKATTLGEKPSDWLKNVKAQIEKLGEKVFLNIFRNRKVVFVYAYLPDVNKSLADESKTKSCLAPEDLKVKEPIKLFAMLIKLGYLDAHGRLTGKFHSIKKDNFKLTEEFAASSEAVFKQLDAFRSVSKSTLAKIELLQLAQNLRALNFEFGIVEIPRANGGGGAHSSLSSIKTPLPNPNISDEYDEVDDSQLLMPTNPVPSSMPTLKITNGPVGYCNIGNACYMIASLQVLFNIPDFRQLVTQKKATTNLIKALHVLLQEKNLDKTRSLITTLRKNVFESAPSTILEGDDRITAQHDAHEFFLFILDRLQWLSFSTKTEFTTSKGTRYSDNEQHRILSLQLSGTTFQNMIDAYFAIEDCADEKEPYQGTFKGKTYSFKEWQQQIQMTTFPKFLFVQLKRFDNEGTKDSTKIQFPLDDIVTIVDQQYEIVGFVNHHGLNANEGHYTADIKNLRDQNTQKWICCDDDAVYESTLHDPPLKAYIIALRKIEKAAVT